MKYVLTIHIKMLEIIRLIILALVTNLVVLKVTSSVFAGTYNIKPISMVVLSAFILSTKYAALSQHS